MISGLFTGFSHRLSKGCMPQLGLLAFKENGNGVVGVLVGHMYRIGRCIVRWQAIQWERILTLHNMRTARTAQHFSSLTYHVWGWTTCLVYAGWVSWICLSGGTGGGDCGCVVLHHPSHTQHGLHLGGYLVLHGLHVSLHLLLHFLYFTYDFGFGMC